MPSDIRPRNPITGIAGCCARAASGHAAAPPSAASNSRRPMVTVMRPSRARCVKGTIPRHERAVFTFKEAGCWLRPPRRSASTTPAASFSRTPPSRPRASARSPCVKLLARDPTPNVVHRGAPAAADSPNFSTISWGLTARLDRHADETEGSVVGTRRLLIIVVRLALLLSLAGCVDRQPLLPVDQ